MYGNYSNPNFMCISILLLFTSQIKCSFYDDPGNRCHFFHKQTERDHNAQRWLQSYSTQSQIYFVTWTVYNYIPIPTSKHTFYGISHDLEYLNELTLLPRKHIKYASPCSVVHIHQKNPSDDISAMRDFAMFYYHLRKPDSVFFYYSWELHFYLKTWLNSSILLYIILGTQYLRYYSNYQCSGPRFLLIPPAEVVTQYRPGLDKTFFPAPDMCGDPIYIIGQTDTDYPKIYQNVASLKADMGVISSIFGHELEILRSSFNFSLKFISRYNHSLYGFPQIMFHFSGEYSETNVMAFQTTVRNHVIYCRSHSPMENTWTVWLSPFGRRIWIIFLVTMVLHAFAVEHGSLSSFCFELYFLLSITLRQPLKEFTVSHLIFGLLTTVITSSYESIITGKIISPSPPMSYNNLGEFINASYQIFEVTAKTSDYNWIGVHPTIVEEYKKYWILHRLNATAHILDSKSGHYGFRLMDESNPAGLMFGMEDGDVVSKHHIISSLVSRVRENFPCSKFSFGTEPSFHMFNLGFVREAIAVHAAFHESGIMRMAQGWETHYYKLLFRKESVHKLLVILFRNLLKFFTIVTLLYCCSCLVFVFELRVVINAFIWRLISILRTFARLRLRGIFRYFSLL